MQPSPNDRGHDAQAGSPRLEGSLLHAQQSLGGIGDGGTQADRPISTGSSSDSATLADGTQRQGAVATAKPAGAAAPSDQYYRPTSYLFEGRDASPTPVAIPEVQKLTVDVPPRDQISIILGPFFIIFGDLVVPCIVYYAWLGAQPAGAPRYNKDILGFAILPFGLGELYILVVRVWRLIKYYAAEDFFAVGGWQKKEFRVRYRQRYDSSIMFQKMIFELTVWWCSGIIVYIGCLSAIIWNTAFEVAFGLSLGLLFSFIISWSIMSYIYIQIALERERKWWINKKSTGEKP